MPVVIETHFELKPIPCRCYDWTAVAADHGGEGPVGYGSTEREARADLLAQLGEVEGARVAFGHVGTTPCPGSACR